MKTWNKTLGMFVMAGLLTVTTAVPVAWAQGGGPGSERPHPPVEQPARPGHALRAIVDPAVIKQAIADALGLPEAELDAAHEAGTPLAELAATQGVSLDAVQAAAKAAAIAQVDQAVADGKITQEVADRLIEQINNHDFPLGGPGAGHPQPGHGLRAILDHAAIKATIATALGLTVADLDAAQQAGTTLEELAASQGVAFETVEAAAKATAIAQVNQAVTDGKLTQAEADRFIAQINNSDFPLPHRPGPHMHEQAGNDNTDETTVPNTAETGQGAASAQEAGNAITAVFLPVVNR